VSTDTWTLYLTPEDLEFVRWGLAQAQELATPSWRRTAAQVQDEVRRNQFDPRRLFRALWPVCGAHLDGTFESLNRSRLRALVLRIKDAVEIFTALEAPHG
jgi:hypothetical protein